MDNVFVKIIEDSNLTDKEACELFKCNEIELKQIKKGTQKPTTEGIYAITKRFGCSMDYVMTGKPTQIADRRLEFFYEKKKAKDNQEIALIEYEEYLLENDIRPTKAMINAFDKGKKVLNTYQVLAINNFNYIEVLSKSSYMPLGGNKASPFKEANENLITNWDNLKKACGKLYVNDILTDDGFAEYALVEDAPVNARKILSEISNGSRKWNPELILKLIAKVACVQKAARIDSNNNLVFQDDFVSTKLLEKLCKEEVENQKKKK
jgi:hypothetical protein